MARTTYSGYYAPLTLDEVLTVRNRLAKSALGSNDFGGHSPIDPNKLASAVERQNTGMTDVNGVFRQKYERPHEKVATLFYGIAKNHAFENGNKRTALVCGLVSLERNGFDLCNTSEEELYEMATTVVAGTFPINKNDTRDADSEVRALGSWFRSRIRKQSFGDHVMSFRELRKILVAHDCEFDSPEKNFIKIRRGSLAVRTGYPKENFDVDVAEIKKIRRQLDLHDLASSRDFYDFDNAVDNFVDEYRYLLQRLADA
ncbi:type II toxin-antitoxin system death-on-curing family toxin [Streptomyces sp. NPDC039028]|uniref:type II toxin-antitoxin system death-on-curing family toxin n=1 Tax=unclassified Streptomyces TaxID=2593676 RepID=UPI0033C9F070